MKKTEFWAFLAMFLSLTPLFSQEMDWDYPIRPGSKEWATLPTTADRVKAIQVPEDVLAKLSDRQLLDLILDYPFFLDYGLTNDPFTGFQRTLETLNAYRAFKARPESLRVIYEYYKDLDFSRINQLKKSSEIGRFSLRISGIELMMTDISLEKGLSLEESKKILVVLSEKFDEKSINESELMGLGKLTTAFLAANLMNGQSQLKNKIEEKEELGKFVSNIRSVSSDFVDQIINELRDI